MRYVYSTRAAHDFSLSKHMKAHIKHFYAFLVGSVKDRVLIPDDVKGLGYLQFGP